MKRLILARHGESEYNVRGILNGDPSVPCALTGDGREQAKQLGELLAGVSIDLCVTTDFQRTIETADIALAGRAIPHLVLPQLNDPPAGDFEGRPYMELNRWRDAHGPDEPIPGAGRSEREFVRTIFEAFEILAARPEETILVIAHGFCVSWILRAVRREDRTIDIGYATPFDIPEAALAAVLEALREDLYRYFTELRPLAIVEGDGNLAIRRMHDHPDEYRLMSRWLSDERVLEFYAGRDDPHSFARAVEVYGPKVRGEEPTSPCILLLHGRPVGYLQYYRLDDWPEWRAAIGLDHDSNAYGLDLFIGEPELWDSGIGTRAVSLALDHLFGALSASLVALAPHVTNARAIRCYEKCGFRKVRIVRDTEPHEGEYRDCWLMVATGGAS